MASIRIEARIDPSRSPDLAQPAALKKTHGLGPLHCAVLAQERDGTSAGPTCFLFCCFCLGLACFFVVVGFVLFFVVGSGSGSAGCVFLIFDCLCCMSGDFWGVWFCWVCDGFWGVLVLSTGALSTMVGGFLTAAHLASIVH